MLNQALSRWDLNRLLKGDEEVKANIIDIASPKTDVINIGWNASVDANTSDVSTLIYGNMTFVKGYIVLDTTISSGGGLGFSGKLKADDGKHIGALTSIDTGMVIPLTLNNNTMILGDVATDGHYIIDVFIVE